VSNIGIAACGNPVVLVRVLVFPVRDVCGHAAPVADVFS
jgi:hypothetical protein